jgi:hypothetical protein
MSKYDVHIYAVTRIKYEGIEASSQREAIEKAEEIFHPADVLDPRNSEFADEFAGFLVDEVGDLEHNKSCFYNARGEPHHI